MGIDSWKTLLLYFSKQKSELFSVSDHQVYLLNHKISQKCISLWQKTNRGKVDVQHFLKASSNEIAINNDIKVFKDVSKSL